MNHYIYLLKSKVLQIKRKIYDKYHIRRSVLVLKKKQRILIENLKNVKVIDVGFFFINVDIWKLDSVYWAFEKDENFRPVIVICPFLGKGEEFTLNELEKSVNYCDKRGYEYVIGFNKSKLKSLNIKEKYDFSIIFFTNPNNLTSKEFLISSHLDKLTCYVPYSFRIDTLYDYGYNNNLVNLTWLNFYETKIHRKLATKHAFNKGENVFVSGFPHLDGFNEKEDVDRSSDILIKTNERKVKKIIWAPHWTIKGYQKTGLDWSCFLDYSHFFLELAEKYSNEIYISLKPHPFLRKTLNQEELWGKVKTDEYFRRWENLENCEVVNGDYKELFMESDALIHDSGSFIVEYLTLNKPTAYTINDDGIDKRFNEFGYKALSCHSLIRTSQELENFIVNVINDNDLLKLEREKIVREEGLKSDTLAAVKIVEYIKSKIR